MILLKPCSKYSSSQANIISKHINVTTNIMYVVNRDFFFSPLELYVIDIQRCNKGFCKVPVWDEDVWRTSRPKQQRESVTCCPVRWHWPSWPSVAPAGSKLSSVAESWATGMRRWTWGSSCQWRTCSSLDDRWRSSPASPRHPWRGRGHGGLRLDCGIKTIKE